MKIKKFKKQTKYKLLETYKSVITGKEELISTDVLDEMAKELIQYCLDDPTATLTKYAVQLKGMPWSSFVKLKDRYEVLGNAYDAALIIIGDKREEGALTNQLNDKVVLKSLPMYLQRWRDIEEWSAKLKKESNSIGTGVFKIEIPSYDDGNKS